MAVSKVAVMLNPDRRLATEKVASEIGLPDLNGSEVFIKPNFNTADPAPGSTHNDTLEAIVELVNRGRPKRVTVGDRSGPAKTRKVFEEKGIFRMSKDLGFQCSVLDELPGSEWVKVNPPDCNWRNGFLFAKPPTEADAVIGLCCLKTHQYGGHFTMGLKLATGFIHRRNMAELHSSPMKQRRMIAEMNVAYTPSLMIMDGVEAFYKGGPMRGPRWAANLTFASSDRIALDAVGVATLKMHGTTKRIESKRIFEHDQIKRAVELGLGARSPKEIELVPVDAASEQTCENIQEILSE
ncbi:MAG: DUF362 domain-containing protein [Thermoplasmata archaeon]|nr:DUF362 domain-containing protein [Thermoplasmata archaeon]